MVIFMALILSMDRYCMYFLCYHIAILIQIDFLILREYFKSTLSIFILERLEFSRSNSILCVCVCVCVCVHARVLICVCFASE